MGKLQRKIPSLKSLVIARAPQIPSLSLHSGWQFHSCGLRSTVIRLKPPVPVFPERTSFDTDRRIGIRFPTEAKYVVFSKTLRPIQPPLQWLNGTHQR